VAHVLNVLCRDFLDTGFGQLIPVNRLSPDETAFRALAFHTAITRSSCCP